MKLTDITEESTEAEVAQALTDNIAEKFGNACPGPSIDKMTDKEVQAELERRGIDSELSYWKHRCRLFEVLNRATDGDLRDQMEITGRKEMELTKLRGQMRRMKKRMKEDIERLEVIIATCVI